MVFSDLFFLMVFLPLFALLYLAAGWMERRTGTSHNTLKNIVLVIFSLLFYAWGEPVYVFLMLVCVLINYIFGLLIGAADRKNALGDGSGRGRPSSQSKADEDNTLGDGSGRGRPSSQSNADEDNALGDGSGRRRPSSQSVDGASSQPRHSGWATVALVLGVVCNLAILCSFKYLNFLAETLNQLGVEVPNPHIALPIGISFYVFQSITYLVDIYRREARVQRNFWSLLLYISMFPQLIAGPIVRYGTVAEEIHHRHVTARDVADGIVRFVIGLAKKVIIANQLGEVATQLIGGGLGNVSVAGAWIGVAAFTLQIYFDFSGYSDMAIGIGRCLGFHFCENFDHPYCSRTITEFWRRWHMSLGTFFRDYVYIPLGGNRRHQMFNIFVVWALTGLWHGASWNFLIWGLYFGIILVVEKRTVMRIRDRVPAPLLHLYTMLIVTFGFGIFYFDDFGRLTEFVKIAFGLEHRPLSDFVSTNILFEKFWLWMAALVLCMPVRRYAVRLTAKVTGGHDHWFFGSVHLVATTVICLVLLVVSIALLVGATNNAFLYTRF